MNLHDDRAGRLILSLRQQGVTDPRVLKAMESIDRAVFVHEKFLDQAWEDQALPIDCAQTISQPYIVGLMTQALEDAAAAGRNRVLLGVWEGNGRARAFYERHEFAVIGARQFMVGTTLHEDPVYARSL